MPQYIHSKPPRSYVYFHVPFIPPPTATTLLIEPVHNHGSRLITKVNQQKLEQDKDRLLELEMNAE